MMAVQQRLTVEVRRVAERLHELQLDDEALAITAAGWQSLGRRLRCH
jgi:hypothetical protein